jgi:hypothetical protein
MLLIVLLLLLLISEEHEGLEAGQEKAVDTTRVVF